MTFKKKYYQNTQINGLTFLTCYVELCRCQSAGQSSIFQVEKFLLEEYFLPKLLTYIIIVVLKSVTIIYIFWQENIFENPCEIISQTPHHSVSQYHKICHAVSYDAFPQPALTCPRPLCIVIQWGPA